MTYSNEMSEQETEIGSVMTYYNNIGVAAIDLTGNVKVGDTIIIRGHTTDVEHVIDSMEIEHKSVQEAKSGDQIGIKVASKLRKKDRVYKK
uniref:Collagenase-related protein n=3 Tax=environmental samples TaxID=651140 RepID=A0A075HZ17_9ARCH|nr:Collagenase-related protein [uncultured marine thaumarchaeote KM3_50_F11]AIF20785.1 Collagenase-related protein [uncultured marine thaumarchaeote KM3_94_B01]